MAELELKKLSIENIEDLLVLTCHLNPEMPIETLRERQTAMFEFQHYNCFGVFEKERLIGVASGWVTVRLYSGRQLEIDNVIVDPSIQSKGYGAQFMHLLEAWAKENKCETVELNTYFLNGRSHKFYLNHNFQMLGFHFQKQL